MTICVSVKVAEGLVMAADSMTMLQGIMQDKRTGQSSTGVLQTFAHANKVSSFLDYPVGIMSWGAASISDRSIQSLIMEVEYNFPTLEAKKSEVGHHGKLYSVLGIGNEVLKFIMERYDDENKRLAAAAPKLGLFIGGYSDGEFFSDIYKCELPVDRDWVPLRAKHNNSPHDFGSNWFGITEPLIRLVNGYSVNGASKLATDFGVDPKAVEAWTKSGANSMPLIFNGMPLQDAVDFAKYLVDVVIGWSRFSLGPPQCGGLIDIAVIRPRSFQWAQRKEWAIKD